MLSSLFALPKKILIPLIGALLAIVIILISAGIIQGLDEKSKLPQSAPGMEKNILKDVSLQGRGRLPHLHLAVAQDPDLQEMLSRLGQVPAERIFIEGQNVDAMVLNLLFRWAGVEDVETDLYGPYIDGRVVAFMESVGAMAATPLSGREIEMRDVAALNTRWLSILDHYRTRLLIQLSGRQIYNGRASYNLAQDDVTVTGTLSPEFIRNFQRELQETDHSGQAMHGFLDFISTTKGFPQLNDAEQDLIMSLNPAAEGEQLQ